MISPRPPPPALPRGSGIPPPPRLPPAPRRSSIRPPPPRPRHFIPRICPGGPVPCASTYTGLVSQAPALPRGFELPLEPRLPRIGSVDAVALEERAASLARRSIKRDAKVFALELAIRMMDLTTLEGQDTPGKIAALASKALHPDPS